MSAHPAADVITRMLLAIDDRDWTAVRGAFADLVRVDYSSLSGAPAATVARDALLDGWRALLPGFDATQHLTGPIVVDDVRDGEVVARMTVRGWHWIGDEEWMVAGQYTMTVVRDGTTWRIAAITLTVSHQSGTLSLPEKARARAIDYPRASR